MKQQVNPIAAVVAGIIVVAVVGLLFYFISNRTASPEAPKQISGAPAPLRNMAPDQMLKTRMDQNNLKPTAAPPPGQGGRSGQSGNMDTGSG